MDKETKHMQVLVGMYDKTCVPTVKDIILDNRIPQSSINFETVDEDMFKVLVISRNDFDMSRFFHGWYVLIPENYELVSVLENNISSINTDHILIKNTQLKKNGVSYKAYGKFSVAKMSDDWSVKLMLLEK